jgi:hypothetical protein
VTNLVVDVQAECGALVEGSRWLGGAVNITRLPAHHHARLVIHRRLKAAIPVVKIYRSKIVDLVLEPGHEVDC